MTAVVLQTVDSILYRHMGVAVRRAAPQRALFGAVVLGLLFVAHGFAVLCFLRFGLLAMPWGLEFDVCILL